MQNKVVFYPKEDVFRDYTRVIPQLRDIINSYQEKLPLGIPKSLMSKGAGQSFSATGSSGDYYFKLTDAYADRICYHFFYKSSVESFQLDVNFSNGNPAGKVQFEFLSQLNNSVLKEKVEKMIDDYVSYSRVTDINHLHLSRGERIFDADISLKGFNFFEGSRNRHAGGGGVSHSLEEFVYESKGHYHVSGVFNAYELNDLVTAAKLRLEYPYLFK
jgi:hypothetical protein